MVETVWAHFWLIQIWLIDLFFAYCTMSELTRAIGRERVIGMFFGGQNESL
jgi:hypothetical protein